MFQKKNSKPHPQNPSSVKGAFTSLISSIDWVSILVHKSITIIMSHFMLLLLFNDICDYIKQCRPEAWLAVPQRREFDCTDIKHSDWICEYVGCTAPTLCHWDWSGIKWLLCSKQCLGQRTGNVVVCWSLGETIHITRIRW